MSEYEMTQKGGRERAVHILLAEQLLGRLLEDNGKGRTAGKVLR